MSNSSVIPESILSVTAHMNDEKRELIRDNLVTLSSLIEGLDGLANSGMDNMDSLKDLRFAILGLSLFWKNHCKDIVWEI